MGMHFARGSQGQDPDQGLARDLSELARQLQSERSMDVVVTRITEAAVNEISGADWAGISEISGRAIVTRAASAPIVEDVDQMQIAAGDGPCLTALREQVTARSDDLLTETRWPDFAQRASERGVRSMLSVQLFVHDDNLGALNLYSAQPDVFDDNAESAAMLLAAHAAVAMKGSRVESNLRIALESRDVIGQAKGIMMERYKISSQEAFELLVMASQRTHRKLREVADELAATGDLRID